MKKKQVNEKLLTPFGDCNEPSAKCSLEESNNNGYEKKKYNFNLYQKEII